MTTNTKVHPVKMFTIKLLENIVNPATHKIAYRKGHKLDLYDTETILYDFGFKEFNVSISVQQEKPMRKKTLEP